MDLAVIYPVYNEVDIIEKTARETVKALEASHIDSYRIVFVTDGSTDGTQRKADELQEEIEEVEHLSHEERLGKGGAFEKAFKQVEAENFAYCDADLSTDLKHLEEGLKYLDQGHDIAVGSRRVSNGFDRGFTREIPSIVFNEALRKFFGSEIYDHQCGFKFFEAEDSEEVIEEVDSDHWFWDAEMLIRGQRSSKNIKEFSVDWEDPGDSKVSIYKDSIYFARKLVELRIDLWR
ncbi:MAG: glycosyltransferase [Candidatus Nanohalobium sp.]